MADWRDAPMIRALIRCMPTDESQRAHCLLCGAGLVEVTGHEATTLGGFNLDGPPHDHDPNRHRIDFLCENGCAFTVGFYPPCPARDCNVNKYAKDAHGIVRGMPRG